MSAIRRLADIAWAHSGDKGDSINLGVVVYDESDYALLLQEVTEARVSKSNPTRGLVRTRNTVIKQDGSVVLVYTPMRMVKCRGN